MQEKFMFLPMVKNYIYMNIPTGSYKMVSNRLKSSGLNLSNKQVLDQIRIQKKNGEDNLPVISECLKLMKENNVQLDSYCLDFIDILNKKEKGR